MPALENMGNLQKAVLWEADGVDDNGKEKVATPVNLKARWEEGETDLLMTDGTRITLAGTLAVNQDIPVNSILWLAPDNTRTGPSALDQWYSLGSAGYDTGLMMVAVASKAVDLKARNTRRELGLTKYKNSLPGS